MRITGFDYQRVTVADGVALNVAVGGAGTPIVLLHGFPQTHLMWRQVAADLAADHTVICPDLRGYGDSDKPADTARCCALLSAPLNPEPHQRNAGAASMTGGSHARVADQVAALFRKSKIACRPSPIQPNTACTPSPSWVGCAIRVYTRTAAAASRRTFLAFIVSTVGDGTAV